LAYVSRLLTGTTLQMQYKLGKVLNFEAHGNDLNVGSMLDRRTESS